MIARRRILERSILLAIGLVVAVLVVSAALSYRNTRQLHDDAEAVAHTHEVLSVISDVLRNQVDAETSERGFLITGKDEFLQPFREARQRLADRIATLKQLTSDNVSQQARVAELELSAAEHMALLDSAIALRRADEKAARDLVATGKARAQLQAIRGLVADLERDEQDLLRDRQARNQSTYQVALTTGLLTGLIGVVMVAAFVWLLDRSLSAQHRTAALLREQQEALRQIAADLSEADRRKDEFLATLAHELRNPLAPLRHGLELIRLAAGQPAIVEQARALMERQLAQLVRLVDDLMDVSRISRGVITLRKEHVALQSVIHSAVEMVRPLVEKMAHQLTVSLPEQPILVTGDPTRLAQVFGNLLTNAAKYTDRGGSIRVSASVESDASDGHDTVRGWRGDTVTAPGSASASPDNAVTDPSGHHVTHSPCHPVSTDGHPLIVSPPHRVTVSVRDTGIGIAAEHLPRLFEMFSQVDRSLERSQGGLGIGLTLVKNLVEMHGGTVEARSDGPGKGSEFVVRLPMAAEAAPATGAPDRPAAAPRPLRILVADDNRDAANSLALMLRLAGHEVTAAHDGQQALDTARSFRPRIVLLDIGMPRLNGYDAARRLRQEYGAGLVLIALTGWGQEEDQRRSQEAGFDHHLVKPVDLPSLERLLMGVKAEVP